MRSRRRSPTAGASAACTRAARRIARADAPRRPGRRDAARDGRGSRRPRAVDRRPRTGGRLGRARGGRPLRDRLRRPRAAAPACSTTTRRSSRWTVPVRGHDPYQVAVGPIHAGVIESGHFRFHVVGDRILHVDVRLFYKHRGLERAAEGATLEEGLAYAARACAACAVTNAVAYAHACEEALGLGADAGARARADDPARARAGVEPSERHRRGLRRLRPRRGQQLVRRAHRARAPAERRAHRPPLPLRHRSRRRQRPRARPRRRASGARGAARRCARTRSAAGASCSSTLRSRTGCPEIGISRPPDAAERLGATGPAARAAGLAHDVRATSPRLAYDGFEPAVPERAAGDVQARLEQRALELRQSFELLDATARPARSHAVAAVTTGEERGARRSAASRARAARRAASSSATATRSSGSGCAPARTRTGRRSRTRPSATSCPTSRSSTRASSSATPASTADADAPPRPAPAPPRASRCRGPNAGRQPRAPPRRRRLVQRLRARADAHLEPVLRPRSASASGIVASPRHADVLLVTGAVTTRMHEPLLVAYRAMPEPRRVVALGDCALGCNLLGRRGGARRPGRGASCPSTCGSPAARRRRRRSPRRC